MPRLVSIATAVPPHVLAAETTKAFLAGQVEAAVAARYLRVVGASRIAKRHLALPAERAMALRSHEERALAYEREAIRLCEEVVTRALCSAGVSGAAIDVIIPVSCTGYLMPSLDAHLINRLGLNPSARRIPITELGCSAGAAGLGLAMELLRGGSHRTALVVSVELCSLCMQQDDPSRSDLLGKLLFADGAAAAVVRGGGAIGGPELLAARSVLIADSLGALATSLTDSGFHLGLSPELPSLLQAHLKPAVDAFLSSLGLERGDLGFFAVHPGGPRIIEAVQESLAIEVGALEPSWDVLEQFGNMSSASIFFVLQRLQEIRCPAAGSLGLLFAFGPGVTCEIVLCRWGEQFASSWAMPQGLGDDAPRGGPGTARPTGPAVSAPD